MRAGFAQFTAFSRDAKDNKIFEQTKLTMPVMAVGGEKSFGPLQAVIMRHLATNVQEFRTITVCAVETREFSGTEPAFLY